MLGRMIGMAMIVTVGLGAMGCGDSFYRNAYNARGSVNFDSPAPACDGDNSLFGALVKAALDGLTNNGHDQGRAQHRSP